MRPTRLPRATGFTLLEAMVAMAVLLIGTMGLISLHDMGVRMNGDARVMTRATALAEDLLAQMKTWNYASDPRLKNASSANDADYTDAASSTFLTKDALAVGDFDHSDDDLDATYGGVTTATAQELGFRRYWNIDVDAKDVDANGAQLGLRVAVIVRWGEPGRWRDVVLTSYLPDPQVTF